jgi:hypothetical protein
VWYYQVNGESVVPLTSAGEFLSPKPLELRPFRRQFPWRFVCLILLLTNIVLWVAFGKQERSRSRGEGDKRTGQLPFERHFYRLEGANSCTKGAWKNNFAV